MKRISLLLAFVSAPLFAQAPDPAQQIHAATVLVDQGKVDEAIAMLRKIVDADPKNDLAAYELGVAYAAKGDAKQCVAITQPIADAAGPHQVAAIGMLGNCLDDLGQRAKAIDAYNRGLKLAPNDAQLAFNLAVSLTRLQKLDDARDVLKRETAVNTGHASSFLLLAKIFEAQNFRVPAIFAFLRFLALEPATPRARETAPHVLALLNAAVSKKSAKETNITIDPNARKEEGDYTPMDMAIAMASAGRDLDEKAKLSEFDKTREQIASVVQMFVEIPDAKQTDYTATVQLPFFASMVKEKQVDAYAGVVALALPLDGKKAWFDAHRSEVQHYMDWIAPQTDRATVMLAH